jgi:hypothetical protein
MITEIRATFDISDEEALYIKEVTEEKVADPMIRKTVGTHREDRVLLDGAYRGQVNGEIQAHTIHVAMAGHASAVSQSDLAMVLFIHDSRLEASG